MLKKQMMFPLAYVLIVAMVLVGCAAQPVPSATGQQAEDQQAMEAEKELVIVQGTEPWTMDMQWVTAQVIVNVGNHIQQTLLDYDHSMTLQPNLAISWEQLEPTVWQYKLREGVQFSNGEPFNAEQVKFSFDRVMAPDSDSMRKGETRYVSSVEVVDDYTVNFHTAGIIPLFDLYVTAKFPIVPQGYITENGAEHFATNPIGTGPYVLEEWVKDDHITLRKNPSYWGEEPKIDVLTFLTVPDISSRVATLLAGEADIATDLQPATVQEVENREGLSVVSRPGMRSVFLLFNTQIESPVTDRRVRQAINYAVDKDVIIESILDGFGKKLEGQVLSEEYWGYQAALEAYPYDPAKAKELLAEAGYPDGFDLRIVSPRGRYMMDAEISQAVAGQLKDVGINVTVDTLEWGVFSEEQYSHEGGPVFLLGYMTVPDAARMLSIWHSTHPNDQHPDAKFDALSDAAINETDVDARREVIKEAVEYFREDAPVVFLHQQYILWGVHDRVQNFAPFPDGRLKIDASVDVSGDR
jgi:peptide/nickel transport system substrate-binding protein